MNFTLAKPELGERRIAGLISLGAATTTPRNLAAYNALDQARKLRPGWDGYVGVPPCEDAIDQAKAFIANMPDEIGAPVIEPSGDGEINLVWRSHSAYLEIGFTGGHGFSFFGKTFGSTPTRDFGDVPINANRLPMALHRWMGLFVDANVRLRERAAERNTFAWIS